MENNHCLLISADSSVCCFLYHRLRYQTHPRGMTNKNWYCSNLEYTGSHLTAHSQFWSYFWSLHASDIFHLKTLCLNGFNVASAHFMRPVPWTLMAHNKPWLYNDSERFLKFSLMKPDSSLSLAHPTSYLPGTWTHFWSFNVKQQSECHQHTEFCFSSPYFPGNKSWLDLTWI